MKHREEFFFFLRHITAKYSSRVTEYRRDQEYELTRAHKTQFMPRNRSLVERIRLPLSTDATKM